MTVWDCDCLKLELACQIVKTVKSCENLPRLSWSCVNSNQGMESKSCLDDFCAWLACNRHLNNTILYCHISPEVKNQGFSCKKISNLTFAIKSMLKIFQKLKIKLIFRTFVLVRKGMFTFCLSQSCGFPFQFSLVVTFCCFFLIR